MTTSNQRGSTSSKQFLSHVYYLAACLLISVLVEQLKMATGQKGAVGRARCLSLLALVRMHFAALGVRFTKKMVPVSPAHLLPMDQVALWGELPSMAYEQARLALQEVAEIPPWDRESGRDFAMQLASRMHSQAIKIGPDRQYLVELDDIGTTTVRLRSFWVDPHTMEPLGPHIDAHLEGQHGGKPG